MVYLDCVLYVTPSSQNITVVLTTTMLNFVKHEANVYETCQGVHSMASSEIYFDNCQLSFIKKTIWIS